MNQQSAQEEVARKLPILLEEQEQEQELVHDVNFILKEGQTISANTSMLCDRSKYFHNLLRADGAKEDLDGRAHTTTSKYPPIYHLNDITAPTFLLLLHYFNTETIPNVASLDAVLDLFMVADKYSSFGDLKGTCVERIKGRMSFDNLAELMIRAHRKGGKAKHIKEMCIKYIISRNAAVIREEEPDLFRVLREKEPELLVEIRICEWSTPIWLR